MVPKKYNTRQNATAREKQEEETAATAEEKQGKEKTALKKKNGENDASSVAGNSTFMDPKLWGTLQNHIDLLESVYCRLPLLEFFEFRAVCKAWYDVACKRMALKEPIHKPFFTLYTRGGRFYRLDGILTCNKVSKCKPVRRKASWGTASASFDYNPSWVWKRRGDSEDLVKSSAQIVANEGLVCRLRPISSRTPNFQVTVHNWNLEKREFPDNYRRNSLGRVPDHGPEQTIVGMMVLQNEQRVLENMQNRRFLSFMIVLGSLERDTQVYDSKSFAWETKPCRPHARGGLRQTTGCAACNGRVYITMEYTREVLVYDFGKASWSSIDGPGGSANTLVSTEPRHYCNGTLGAWNGRVLDVVDDADSSSLSLWELIDEGKQEWKVFDTMPRDLYSWFRFKHDSYVTVHASFCGDYVLVYSWFFNREAVKEYCLYNMATKVWQKLDVDGKNSLGTVFIKRRHGSDDRDGWDK